MKPVKAKGEGEKDSPCSRALWAKQGEGRRGLSFLQAVLHESGLVLKGPLFTSSPGIAPVPLGAPCIEHCVLSCMPPTPCHHLLSLDAAVGFPPPSHCSFLVTSNGIFSVCLIPEKCTPRCAGFSMADPKQGTVWGCIHSPSDFPPPLEQTPQN